MWTPKFIALCCACAVFLCCLDATAAAHPCTSFEQPELCGGWEALLPVIADVEDEGVETLLTNYTTTTTTTVPAETTYFNGSVSFMSSPLGLAASARECVSEALLALELHVNVDDPSVTAEAVIALGIVFSDALQCRIVSFRAGPEGPGDNLPLSLPPSATLLLRGGLVYARPPVPIVALFAGLLCSNSTWCHRRGRAEPNSNSTCACVCSEGFTGHRCQVSLTRGDEVASPSIPDPELWVDVFAAALPGELRYAAGERPGSLQRRLLSRELHADPPTAVLFDAAAVAEERFLLFSSDTGNGSAPSLLIASDAVRFEGFPPRGLEAGALPNGTIIAAHARTVHSALASAADRAAMPAGGAPSLQVSDVATSAVNIGPIGARQERTISLWLRVTHSTEGFAFLLTDNWMSGVHRDAPLAREALWVMRWQQQQRHEGSKKWAPPGIWHGNNTGFVLNHGLYLDGPRGEIVFVFQGEDRILHRVSFVRPRLFDDTWHLVALGLSEAEGSRVAQLFLDGETSFSITGGWRQCLPLHAQGNIQPLRMTHHNNDAPEPVRVPNLVADTVFVGGALHLGVLQVNSTPMGIFDLRVHETLLSQRELVLLGAEPMERHAFILVEESISLGLVLGLTSVATIFSLVRFFYSDIYSVTGNEVDLESVDALMDQHKLSEWSKKKAKKVLAARHTAVRRAGQSDTFKKIGLVFPLAIAPVQTMTLFFRGFGFPLQFQNPFSLAVFVFSIDLNLVFSGIRFDITPLLQFSVMLLVMVIFLVICVRDNDAFRRKVIEGERRRQHEAAAASEGGAESDATGLGMPIGEGEGGEKEPAQSPSSSPRRAQQTHVTAAEDSVPSPVLYPQVKNSFLLLDDAASHAPVMLSDEGNTRLQCMIDTLESRGAMCTPTPLALLLTTAESGSVGDTHVGAATIVIRKLELAPATVAEAPANRVAGSAEWTVGPQLHYSSDTLRHGQVLIAIDTSRCPLHDAPLIRTVDGVHTLVPLRDDGSEPYACSYRQNTVFRRVRGPTCDAHCILVCPKLECGFSACAVCYGGLDPAQNSRLSLRTKLWRLKRAGIREIMGNLTIIVAQALFVPAIMSSLMILSCHHNYACHLQQNCYEAATGEFVMLVSTAAVVLVVAGFVFGISMSILLARRKLMIVNSGLWAWALKPPPTLRSLIPCWCCTRDRTTRLTERADRGDTPERVNDDGENVDVQQQQVGQEEEEAEKDQSADNPFVPVTLREKLLCGMDDAAWRDLLEADHSVCRILYENYEHTFLCLYPTLLAFKLLIVASVVLLPSGSLSQLITTSTFEVLQLMYIGTTNAMIDPWLDLLARAGSLHSVLQLCFLSFHRVMTADEPRSIGLVYGMMAASLLFVLVVLLVLIFDVILPHVRSKRRAREEQENLRKTRLAEREAATRAQESEKTRNYVINALESGRYDAQKLRKSLYANTELAVTQAMVQPMRHVLELLALYVDSSVGNTPGYALLTRVELTKCISPELGPVFCEMVSRNCVMTHLVASDNNFDSTTLAALSDALRVNRTLLHVDLSNSLSALKKVEPPRARGPAAVKFCSFMAKNGTLTHLNLSRNAGCKELLAAMSKSPCSVKELVLEDCWSPASVSSHPAAHTTQIMEVSGYLAGIVTHVGAHARLVSFSGNFLGDDGAAAVCTAIQKVGTQCTLEVLQLARTHVSSHEAVCELLRKNKSISRLVLSGNAIDPKNIKKLVQTAVQSPVLHTLELARCAKMRATDEVELRRMLDTRSTLRLLVLHQAQLQETPSAAIDFLHGSEVVVPRGVRVSLESIRSISPRNVCLMGYNQVSAVELGSCFAGPSWHTLTSLAVPQLADLDVLIKLLVKHAKRLPFLTALTISDGVCGASQLEVLLERFVFVRLDTMQRLGIAGIPLSASAIKTLADLLADPDCALAHLDLSRCPWTGRGDAGSMVGQPPVFREELVPALVANGSLTTVALAGIGLGDEVADAIAAQLAGRGEGRDGCAAGAGGQRLISRRASVTVGGGTGGLLDSSSVGGDGGDGGNGATELRHCESAPSIAPARTSSVVFGPSDNGHDSSHSGDAFRAFNDPSAVSLRCSAGSGDRAEGTGAGNTAAAPAVPHKRASSVSSLKVGGIATIAASHIASRPMRRRTSVRLSGGVGGEAAAGGAPTEGAGMAAPVPPPLTTTLTSLDIAANSLSSKSLKQLLRHLTALTSVTASDLAGAVALSDIVTCAPRLVELSLQRCQVVLASAERLARSSVETLELIECKMAPDTIEAIGASVQLPGCRLRALRVRNAAKYAASLLRAAIRSRTLREIDVRAAAAASSVTTADTITDEAGTRHGTAEGAATVVSGSDLREIAISLGAQRADAIALMAEVLRGAHSLERLRIRESLDAAERRALAVALASNVTVLEVAEADWRPEQDRFSALFRQLCERNTFLSAFVAEYVKVLLAAVPPEDCPNPFEPPRAGSPSGSRHSHDIVVVNVADDHNEAVDNNKSDADADTDTATSGAGASRRSWTAVVSPPEAGDGSSSTKGNAACDAATLPSLASSERDASVSALDSPHGISARERFHKERVIRFLASCCAKTGAMPKSEGSPGVATMTTTTTSSTGEKGPPAPAAGSTDSSPRGDGEVEVSAPDVAATRGEHDEVGREGEGEGEGEVGREDEVEDEDGAAAAADEDMGTLEFVANVYRRLEVQMRKEELHALTLEAAAAAEAEAHK